MLNFFTKKKNFHSDQQKSNGSEYQNELKLANENLYKHSFELAVKNKTLSLLSKLYEISIKDLGPKDLFSEMLSDIQADLSLEYIAIYTNSKSEGVKLLSSKVSSRMKSALESEDMSEIDLLITEVETNPLFRIVFSGNVANTENFTDLYDNPSIKTKIAAVAGESHIKTTIAYPLKINNKIIGFWILSLNKSYDDLVAYEKESIRSVVNVLAVALDKAQLYQKLRVTNESLEVANEGQSKLLHFITHQVKGYFTKSKYIFNELKSGEYGDFSDAAETMIKQGFGFAAEGVDLVQNVLNAANIERGTIKYEKEEVDLKKTLEQVVEHKMSQIKEKGLELKLNIDESDFMIKTDPTQVKEVFKNLIDNAIRYTASGSIVVKLSHNDGMILFAVKDSGVGILKKDMKKLFKKGGKGTDSNKFNAESTGYGLYIAKEFVESALGGRIWVESEGRNKGATFFVQVPLNK